MENKVYVLHLVWEFDGDSGSEIEGVYTTLELAKQAKKELLMREYETSWINEYLDSHFIPLEDEVAYIAEYDNDDEKFYLANNDGGMTEIYITEHKLKA